MAAALVNLELDPIFLRALRLLHSKAKDSAEQLRQMLEDVLQQKPINPQLPLSKEKISLPSVSANKKSDNSSKIQLLHIKKSPKQESGVITPNLQIKKASKDESKKREPEKRNFDKIKQEVCDTSYEVKKPRMDSYKDSPNLSPPTLKLEIKQDDEESDLGNTDADDFAMEMGLACIVCRNIDVSSGNQLVECQECHNLYHQECHKPPITDQDVNDPRLAWYCAKCTKNIKKLATKSQKPNKAVTSSVTKEHSNITKINKPETTSIIASSRLFKRTEVKSPLSMPIASNNNKNPSSSNKPTGLAGLAASLSGRSNSGKVSQSSSGSKSVPSSKSVLNSSKSTSSVTQLAKSNSFSVSSSSKNHSNNGNHSSKLPSSSSFQLKSTSTNSASGSNNGSSGNGNSGNSTSSGNGNSGSGSNSSNHNNGKNSMIAADKRLQIMKKKAEKKMQEKRRK